MCTEVGACEEMKHLETKHKTDITKYWSIISGLVALVITLVIFYANSLHAMDQVKDHEQRIRSMEKTIVSNETLLKEIAKEVATMNTKLDRYIEKGN
jgi:hypothetical protein